MRSEKIDNLSSIKTFFWVDHATKRLQTVLNENNQMNYKLTSLKNSIESFIPPY